VIAGVAAGVARYLDVDPVLARLGFVLLAFANGVGFLLYLAAWALVPRAEPERGEAVAEDPTAPGFASLRDGSDQVAADVRRAASDPAAAQLAIGSTLVVSGGLLLAHNLGWLHWPHWLRFETLWPLLLIALGLGLVFKSKRIASA
jgi:phage shock protein PspC (stress-responsive transcriptional regulator)